MAGAFNTGFQQGANMYNSGQRNRLAQEAQDLEKARDERAALRDAQLLAQGELTLKGQRRTEAATQALSDASAFGIGLPDNQAANSGLQRQAFRQSEIGQQNYPQGGMGEQQAPAYQAPVGLLPAYRPAGDLEMNKLRGSLADAKGDIAGAETLRLGRKGIEYEDGYKKYSGEWSAMSGQEKSDLITKLSNDTGIKGNGNWVAGTGKQQGYMNFLPPSGDPVRLSEKETGDLFVLTNLMSIDPMRARAEMDKVSDKVRLVASQAFEATVKGVKLKNDVTDSVERNISARISAGASATSAGASLLNARSQAGLREEQIAVLKDGTANRAAASQISEAFDALSPEEQQGPRGQGLVRQFNMVNAKAGGQVSLGGANQKRAVDPQAYASVLEKMTNVYGAGARAQMETDKLFGTFGAGADTGLAASLEKLNAEKGKKPAVDKPAAPAFDEEGRPLGGRAINPGYGTLDARGLLRTPGYSVGPNRFNPD